MGFTLVKRFMKYCAADSVVFFHHVPLQYMKKLSPGFTDLSMLFSSIHHLPGSLAEACSVSVVVGLSITSSTSSQEVITRPQVRMAASIH